MKDPNSTISKSAMLVLALSPILQAYAGVGHFNLAEVLLLVLCGISLVINGEKTLTSLPKLLVIYFAFWTFGVLFMSAITGTSIYPILGPIRSFIVWAFVFYAFKPPVFLKAFKTIAIFSILYFFLQLFTNELLHIRLSGFIPGLPLNEYLTEADVVSKFADDWRRFASFFSEPAFFAQYIILLLPIELFYDKAKNRYLIIVLTIVALLLSNSGNAIIGLLAVILSYLLYLANKKNKAYKVFGFVIVLLLVLIVGKYYFGSEMGQSLLGRQEELTGEVGDSSGFVRVVRGYYIIQSFDLFQFIFGINGTELYSRAINSSGIGWAFADGDYYFNGFQTIIIRTGLVGLVLLYSFIIQIWRKGGILSQSILLIYIFASFVAASFFSFSMCIQFVLAYSMARINEVSTRLKKYDNSI